MDEIDINQSSDGSFQDALLRIGFGVLIFSIISLAYMTLMARADLNFVIYPLLVHTPSIFSAMLLATFCAIPIFLMLNILFVLAKLFIVRDYHIRNLRELPISLTAFALAFISLLILFSGHSLEHIDNHRLHNKIYNLAALREYDDMKVVPLILYECSSEGLFCNRIYQSPSELWNTKKTRLVTDQILQTISIYSDNQLIYTYTPQ